MCRDGHHSYLVAPVVTQIMCSLQLRLCNTGSDSIVAVQLGNPLVGPRMFGVRKVTYRVMGCYWVVIVIEIGYTDLHIHQRLPVTIPNAGFS
jgi:hypothetical protein